jgi:hypothetical protein
MPTGITDHRTTNGLSIAVQQTKKQKGRRTAEKAFHTVVVASNVIMCSSGLWIAFV